MNIEKLCEEFHEKIGKDKTVKILVEEGDTEDMTGWFTGVMRPEVWEGIKSQPKVKNPKPFIKLSKGNGIEYSYISFKKVQEVQH
ncbi:hypothetical protein SL057_002436 [Flavobacterium psychrophilum]|nr:hypothetical protein [Flavobacterium psychrophilum]ELY2011366.1 hypothetical protein [Flavobacterium psychrophilum]